MIFGGNETLDPLQPMRKEDITNGIIGSFKADLSIKQSFFGE